MIIFIFFLSILFLFVKKLSVLDPAKLFLIVWGGQVIFISLLFYITGVYTFSIILPVYLFVIINIFIFGSLIGKLLASNIPYSKKKIDISDNAFYLYLLILAIALIYPIILAMRFDFSFSSLFSIDQLLESSHNVAIERYGANNSSSSIFGQILLIFVYLVPIYAGYLSVFLSKKRKKYCFLSFVPALLSTLVSNGKLAVIVCVLFWFSGMFAAKVYSNKKITSFNFRKIILFFVGAFLFCGFLFFSMVLRAGKFDAEMFSLLQAKFLNYMGGHLPALDIWLSRNLDYSNYTYGLKTFYGITNFLGLTERQQGIFSDSIYYGTLDGNEMNTNVFTIFRFLIEDYGFVGSFFFMIFTSICIGYTYSVCRKKDKCFFCQTILVIAYFSIFDSILTTPFTYTSYLFAFFLFYFLLKFSFKKG
jgi:oligosaccharide repeat unit polymerase